MAHLSKFRSRSASSEGSWIVRLASGAWCRRTFVHPLRDCILAQSTGPPGCLDSGFKLPNELKNRQVAPAWYWQRRDVFLIASGASRTIRRAANVVARVDEQTPSLHRAGAAVARRDGAIDRSLPSAGDHERARHPDRQQPVFAT